MYQKSLYSILMLLGILPFGIAALAPLFNIFTLPLIGDIQRSGALYALVVVSFMAGGHWGIVISHTEKSMNKISSQQLMISSNLFPVVPWLCYVIFAFHWAFYASLVLAFLLIALTDAQLNRAQIISEHYYRTRRLINSIIIVCLLLALIANLVN